MAYGVIMLYHLHMPSYILRTFTEYPSLVLRSHTFVRHEGVAVQGNVVVGIMSSPFFLNFIKCHSFPFEKQIDKPDTYSILHKSRFYGS